MPLPLTAIGVGRRYAGGADVREVVRLTYPATPTGPSAQVFWRRVAGAGPQAGQTPLGDFARWADHAEATPPPRRA